MIFSSTRTSESNFKASASAGCQSSTRSTNCNPTLEPCRTGFTTNGYRVESATSLVPPVAWQTNSTAPIVIGGQNVIINPITGSHQFFRLFNP